jgi:excinuclease ABC subunit C
MDFAMNSQEQRLHGLIDKSLHATDGPGVYRMLDKEGKIIYIGKAKSLRNRVRSYFQPNHENAKTRALVNRIHNFEVILTKTEAEALILESILIKKHKPRYNILLKDDKSYPYVMIDENHSFPKMQYVRKPRKGRKVRLFGPFASATSLRSAIRTVNRIFKLRDCSDAEFANRSRPCINYQIGICTAPCTHYITMEDYKKDVDRALQVLSGHGKEAVEQLKSEMDLLSENMEFEQAARVRDQLNFLTDTIERRKNSGSTVEREAREGGNRDVVGWYRKPDSATIALLFVRGGNLVDSTTFHLDGLEGRSDDEVLSEFLAQYYLTDDQLENAEGVPADTLAYLGAQAKVMPTEVLLPFTPPECGLLTESLEQLGHSMSFVVPQKGPKAEILALAKKNAENAFDEKQREKGSIYRVLSELKDKLKLENYPRRMECYDISNLGDTGIVASRVTFIEGKAEKSLYRHYKIRSTQTQNDFASMREVIERRLLKTMSDATNYEEPPDLMIIDGGKGQLAMAMEVFKELNITGVDLVSLAKARNVEPEEIEQLKAEGREVERAYERIFKPGRLNPILLSPDHHVTHLLQRIRDEAHRFAIEFQRKQRKMF